MITREEYIKAKEFESEYHSYIFDNGDMAKDEYYATMKKYAKMHDIVAKYEREIKWWQIGKRTDVNYIPRLKSGDIAYKTTRLNHTMNLIVLVSIVNLFLSMPIVTAIMWLFIPLQFGSLIISNKKRKLYQKELREYMAACNDKKKMKQYKRSRKLERVLIKK